METTDEQHHQDHKVTYLVNGEKQETLEHKLTVAQILERAGFTPATEYQLIRDEGHHKFENYEQEVHLHDGERFTATFIGPTPTS
jgi:AraC-like DNA-binding protein